MDSGSAATSAAISSRTPACTIRGSDSAYGARWTPSSVTIARDQLGRRDVERRIAGGEARRDLGAVALLDRDLRAGRRVGSIVEVGATT